MEEENNERPVEKQDKPVQDDGLEDSGKDLEKQFEDLGKDLEKQFDDVGKEIEENFKGD